MIKNLGGKWSVAPATGESSKSVARKRKGWIEAKVPGCVHLDLLRAGRIPDPFYGMNELDVQWVEAEDWVYRHEFDVPAEMLEAERVDLVCEGLDTFATVLVNDKKVGRADNMFCFWRWDVTGLLKEGRNQLVVHFESAVRVGRVLEKKYGAMGGVGFEASRAYVRREQCATGWDWGPRLSSCGIWRPIYLHAYNAARIMNVHAPVDWSDPKKPVVKVKVGVEALRPGQVKLRAVLRDAKVVATDEIGGRVKKGRNVLRGTLTVPNPKLWWPVGQGEPHLYELTVTGSMGGDEVEPHKQKIGLRRVELLRDRDDEGESFVICINDRPVFCKGANWIPDDSFLPRVTRERYRDVIRMAADANMNMLRVWGGGIYETKEFYELCDELGMMVWQDFAFACSRYPDNLKWFRDSVRLEAEQTVRRLRNHPSLVVWCGNNENHWGYVDWWNRAEPWGRWIYNDMLPDICGELDPSRPYWPGSPYGGKHPNDPGTGDQHFWTVWFQWAPATFYRTQKGRFVSEFGMQAPPTLETIHEYVQASERHMQSRTMALHNKCDLGTERVYRYMAEHFRVPGDFENTVYLMQLTQGEMIKTGVEFWRSRKFLTAGTLFWQLNDCWPVISWSCIDSCHRPKALYYYAKRFFAPVHAVVDRADGKVAVTVINDRPEAFKGKLACGMSDVDGSAIRTAEVAVRVPANGTAVVKTWDEKDLRLSDPTRQFFWCRLLEGREAISFATCFFAPIKHVHLVPVGWEMEVRKASANAFDVTLESSAFARSAWLRVEGMEVRFSDNFFDALPSVPVTVRLVTDRDCDAQEIERRLQIKTVGDVQQA